MGSRVTSAHFARRWLAATLVVVVACDPPPTTQLLVVVSSEPVEGRFIERVEVEVRSADDLTTYDRASFARGAARTLPLSFGVAPRGESTPESVRIVARGFWTDEGGLQRVETVAETSFLADRRLLLPLVLDARCAERRSGLCPAGTICGDGGCVAVRRDPNTLVSLPAGGGVPGADGGACGGARDDAGHCDRCAEGNHVAVARGYSTTHAYVYSTDLAQVDCCGQRLENESAFFVHPVPRPDLLPFYICEMGDGRFLYTSMRNCEGNGRNVGLLGYVVPESLPRRCGSVPLYRLYRADINDHFYSTSAAERDAMLRTGAFTDEGVAAYVWTAAR